MLRPKRPEAAKEKRRGEKERRIRKERRGESRRRVSGKICLTLQPKYSRGVKDGDKSPAYNIIYKYKTYLPKGLTQNNHGFQLSLAQIKKIATSTRCRSGLFRKKTVKTFNGWISCLALTAPTSTICFIGGVLPSAKRSEGRVEVRVE